MNNRGVGGIKGMALLLLGFLFIISVFGLIDPLKENLDVSRSQSSLNCKGTDSFNQTAFDEDESNNLNKLTRRTTCFATGMTLVYFVGSFLIAVVVWVVAKWKILK